MIKPVITSTIFTALLVLISSCQLDEKVEKNIGSTGPESETENNFYNSHLPFDSASTASSNSNKKVFAHYFLPYPLSIDNKLPADGYYQKHYLNPQGERGKFLTRGGLLRQSPLLRAPIPEYEPFKITDMRQEIRLAKAIGIDGFALNIMSLSGANWNQTMQLFDVAQEEAFSILVMPDMNAKLKTKPDEFVPLIEKLAQHSASYRLPDGRLVVAPYLAENQTPQWWKNKKSELKQRNIDIALVPVFHDMQKQLKDYQTLFGNELPSLLYGASEWGPRTPSGAERLKHRFKQIEDAKLHTMSPVSPQDMRPKSSLFTESHNSEAYRLMWQSAIDSDADWVHIISWNDYSESTEISPSTLTRYAFYDLTAFYIDWFKRGQPTIVRDSLYAFYRTQPWEAKTNYPDLQTMKPTVGYFPRNEIELLAFLTEPGILQIHVNNKVQSFSAEAGISSFKIPLEIGRPEFRLLRDNKVVERIDNSETIQDEVDISNLLYQGFTSRRVNSVDNSALLSWPWRYKNFDSDMSLKNIREKSPFPPLKDEAAIVYSDMSTKHNSGIGYSFVATHNTTKKAGHEPSPIKRDEMRIFFDFKIQPLADNNGEYHMVLTALDDKSALAFTLTHKSDDTYCLTVEPTVTSTNDCTTTLDVNHWYRLETEIATTSSGKLSLLPQLQDRFNHFSDLAYEPIEIEYHAINGIRLGTGGPVKNKAKLYLDNLSVEITH